MDPSSNSASLPALLVLIVALIYSSVGHGGASGYLLVLSLFAFPRQEMATSALILNIIVSSIAFLGFWRAGHFSWDKTWPFIVLSIPFSFLGGLIHVSAPLYDLLLAAALIFASFRLALSFCPISSDNTPSGVTTIPRATSAAIPRLPAFAAGAGIGLASGIVGIGGGVFLSPLMLLFRWADPKQTAASSALFILLNSLAGLIGKSFQGISIAAISPVILIAAIAGGLVGTSLGARVFPMTGVRRVLAAVLLVAAVRLVYTAIVR